MAASVPRIGPEMIVQALEGVALSSNGLTTKEIAKYIGKTEAYAGRAIQVGRQFRWIVEKGQKYCPIGDCFNLAKADKKQKRAIFRGGLQSFHPFILFVTLILKGDAPTDAARKISVIFDIKTNEQDILRSFCAWGKYAGLIKEQMKGSFVINLDINIDKLSQQYIYALLEALQNELKTRVYITDKLTSEVFAFLSQEEVDLLAKALSEHAKNPQHTIEDTGKAFEDFLRSIAAKESIDVSNKSGIVEIVNEIQHKNPRALSPKQASISQGLGMVRTMAAHSKDKKTGTPWKINSDAALEYCLITMSTMRSIFTKVERNFQQF